jgi:hypothetical protein
MGINLAEFRDHRQKLIAGASAGARKRREREALERSFERFQFTGGGEIGSERICMSGTDVLDSHVAPFKLGSEILWRCG